MKLDIRIEQVENGYVIKEIDINAEYKRIFVAQNIGALASVVEKIATELRDFNRRNGIDNKAR